MPKKGYKRTEENKKNISLANLRRFQNPEERRKLSEAHKGQKAWNKGKRGLYRHSEETKEKMKGKRIISEEIHRKRSEVMRGENNWNWKGGISKIDKLIRTMGEYHQWRSNIFVRDNWICQTCRKIGVYVTAHHKKSFSLIIKEYNLKTREDARRCAELWDLDNGVTLCEDCHKLTDNYKGRNKAKQRILINVS